MADEHDTSATLADTVVVRYYLRQLGGLDLAPLGNKELERFIVSSIRTPSEVFGLRVVQALLEARLQVREAVAKALQAERQAAADFDPDISPGGDF